MAHIRRLREKIEADPLGAAVSLVTARGLGYKLVERGLAHGPRPSHICSRPSHKATGGLRALLHQAAAAVRGAGAAHRGHRLLPVRRHRLPGIELELQRRHARVHDARSRPSSRAGCRRLMDAWGERPGGARPAGRLGARHRDGRRGGLVAGQAGGRARPVQRERRGDGSALCGRRRLSGVFLGSGRRPAGRGFPEERVLDDDAHLPRVDRAQLPAVRAADIRSRPRDLVHHLRGVASPDAKRRGSHRRSARRAV